VRRSLLLLALLAWPAAARDIPILFAPPLDQPLVYRIEQHRPVADRTRRFSAVRDLRFERAGEGYLLIMTLRAIDSDAPAPGADPYRAALEPLIGIPMRFRVDASGKIVALDGMEAVWTRVTAGVDAMLGAFPPDSERHRAAQRVKALFAALPSEGRLALLAGEVQPLFLFSGSQVSDGAGKGVRTVAGSPLGRPVAVEGTLLVTHEAEQAVDLEEKLAGEGVRVTTRYHVSRRTGLVDIQERSLAVHSQALTERRSLTTGN
jgi:hypothetical protein